jgi:hypothetical protein
VESLIRKLHLLREQKTVLETSVVGHFFRKHSGAQGIAAQTPVCVPSWLCRPRARSAGDHLGHCF